MKMFSVLCLLVLSQEPASRPYLSLFNLAHASTPDLFNIRNKKPISRLKTLSWICVHLNNNNKNNKCIQLFMATHLLVSVKLWFVGLVLLTEVLHEDLSLHVM
jgi:hypothetical protein